MDLVFENRFVFSFYRNYFQFIWNISSKYLQKLSKQHNNIINKFWRVNPHPTMLDHSFHCFQQMKNLNYFSFEVRFSAGIITYSAPMMISMMSYLGNINSYFLEVKIPVTVFQTAPIGEWFKRKIMKSLEKQNDNLEIFWAWFRARVL